MCDQTLVLYLPGDIVWVKLSNIWWPAEVQDEANLDEEITGGLKKKPLAIVKFFNEDSYEFPKNLDQIYHYNCLRKDEFIRKGLDLCRAAALKANRNIPSSMEKFPKDVVTAELKTNGDPEYIKDPKFIPEDKKVSSDEDTPSKSQLDGNGPNPFSKLSKSFKTPSPKVTFTMPNTKRSKSSTPVTTAKKNLNVSGGLPQSILKKKTRVSESGIDDTKLKFECSVCKKFTSLHRDVILRHLSQHFLGKLSGKLPCVPLRYSEEYEINITRQSEEPHLAVSNVGKSRKRRKAEEINGQKKKKVDSERKEKGTVTPSPSTKDSSVKDASTPGIPKKRSKKGKSDDVELEALEILKDWEDFSDDEDKEKGSKPHTEGSRGVKKDLEELGPSKESTLDTSVSPKTDLPLPETNVKKPETSCFDFEDNDDSLNVDQALKFGQKLPRVLNDKQLSTRIRTSSKNDDSREHLNREVDTFLATIDIPTLPELPSTKSSTELDIADKKKVVIEKKKTENKLSEIGHEKSIELTKGLVSDTQSEEPSSEIVASISSNKRQPSEEKNISEKEGPSLKKKKTSDHNTSCNQDVKNKSDKCELKSKSLLPEESPSKSSESPKPEIKSEQLFTRKSPRRSVSERDNSGSKEPSLSDKKNCEEILKGELSTNESKKSSSSDSSNSKKYENVEESSGLKSIPSPVKLHDSTEQDGANNKDPELEVVSSITSVKEGEIGKSSESGKSKNQSHHFLSNEDIKKKPPEKSPNNRRSSRDKHQDTRDPRSDKRDSRSRTKSSTEEDLGREARGRARDDKKNVEKPDETLINSTKHVSRKHSTEKEVLKPHSKPQEPSNERSLRKSSGPSVERSSRKSSEPSNERSLRKSSGPSPERSSSRKSSGPSPERSSSRKSSGPSPERSSSRKSSGPSPERSSSRKSSGPSTERSSSRKSAGPSTERSSTRKSSGPSTEKSSSRKSSEPTTERSSPIKSSEPSTERSSPIKSSEPSTDRSSPRKSSGSSTERSSLRKSSLPSTESSPRKSAEPSIERSSLRKSSGPSIERSSSRKSSEPSIERSSSRKSSEPSIHKNSPRQDSKADKKRRHTPETESVEKRHQSDSINSRTEKSDRKHNKQIKLDSSESKKSEKKDSTESKRKEESVDCKQNSSKTDNKVVNLISDRPSSGILANSEKIVASLSPDSMSLSQQKSLEKYNESSLLPFEDIFNNPPIPKETDIDGKDRLTSNVDGVEEPSVKTIGEVTPAAVEDIIPTENISTNSLKSLEKKSSCTLRESKETSTLPATTPLEEDVLIESDQSSCILSISKNTSGLPRSDSQILKDSGPCELPNRSQMTEFSSIETVNKNTSCPINKTGKHTTEETPTEPSMILDVPTLVTASSKSHPHTIVNSEEKLIKEDLVEDIPLPSVKVETSLETSERPVHAPGSESNDPHSKEEGIKHIEEKSNSSLPLVSEDITSLDITSMPIEIETSNGPSMEILCGPEQFDTLPGSMLLTVYVRRKGDPFPKEFDHNKFRFTIKADENNQNLTSPCIKKLPFPVLKPDPEPNENMMISSAANATPSNRDRNPVNSRTNISSKVPFLALANNAKPVYLTLTGTRKYDSNILSKLSTTKGQRIVKLISKPSPKPVIIPASRKLDSSQIATHSKPPGNIILRKSIPEEHKRSKPSNQIEGSRLKHIPVPSKGSVLSAKSKSSSGGTYISSSSKNTVTDAQTDKKPLTPTKIRQGNPNILLKSPKKVTNRNKVPVLPGTVQTSNQNVPSALEPVLYFTVDQHGKYLAASSDVSIEVPGSIVTSGSSTNNLMRISNTNSLVKPQGQDILAEALANTQVLQSDLSDLDNPQYTRHFSPTILTNNVLETSLTLNQPPIMSPLEVPSSVPPTDPSHPILQNSQSMFYISSPIELLNNSIVVAEDSTSCTRDQRQKFIITQLEPPNTDAALPGKDLTILPESLNGDFTK